MQFIGVIPARFASTRFPGKPLHKIQGKPLLQWVIEGAKTAKHLDQILVATDHADIASLAEKCGAKAVMTDSELPSGSDRVWAAVEKLDCQWVMNIQGDEPLITGSVLDALAAELKREPAMDMATLGKKLEAGDLENPSAAKIVVNQRNEALYFSRYGIPFSRNKETNNDGFAYKHLGIYGYRKAFLNKFCSTGRVGLEIAEDLEQLRALYLGARIKVVVVDHESIGVDTPADVERVEKILKLRTK